MEVKGPVHTSSWAAPLLAPELLCSLEWEARPVIATTVTSDLGKLLVAL